MFYYFHANVNIHVKSSRYICLHWSRKGSETEHLIYIIFRNSMYALFMNVIVMHRYL